MKLISPLLFLLDIKSSTWTVYNESRIIAEKDYGKRGWFTDGLMHYMYKHPQGILVKDENNICNSNGKCRIRCLPYFMLLGMAKSGTTDFSNRIQAHPLVFGGVKKEPFYWSQLRMEINATIGDYSDIFDVSLRKILQNPYDGEDDTKLYPQILGEFTSFTFSDDGWWTEHPDNQDSLEPKRLKVHDIHDVLPNVKLLVILRNPVTRLYSSYNMFRLKKGRHNPTDFHQRVVKSIEWWHNCTELKKLPRRRCMYGNIPEMPPNTEKDLGNRWDGETNVANYSTEIRKSMYAIILKDWLSVFPKEQFLVLKTEEYSQKPVDTFNNVVLPFLNMPVMGEPEDTKMDKEEHSNTRRYDPMLPETRDILTKFYVPFNKELAELLGDDKWLWTD